MSKLSVFVIFCIVFLSCGDKRNIDSSFHKKPSEVRVEDLSPEIFPPSVYINKLSKNSVLFTLYLRQGSFLLNANLDSLKVFDSDNQEQGEVLCLNTGCTQYHVKLFDQYRVYFRLKTIKVTSRFDGSFVIEKSGKELEFSLVHDGNNYSGRYIRTYSDYPDGEELRVFQTRLVNQFDTKATLNIYMPVRINEEDVYYRFRTLSSYSDSNTLEGYYLLVDENKTGKFTLEIEHED